MTLAEIKQTYTMREIVERYGIEIKRRGFISCPFHAPDKTPSCKIYEKTFYCFACGAHGDILNFVMQMDHVEFKDAFLLLGGTYPNNSKAQQNIIKYHAQKMKEKRIEKEKAIKEAREKNNKLITLYEEQLKQYTPFSDEWCETQSKLQHQLYIRDCCHDV